MLGFLDDLVLVPAGIWIAMRMIPAEVLDECRARSAEALSRGGPSGRAAAIGVVATWVVLAVVAAIFVAGL